MKTINLYFDFKFTSLSPDAQPISLGIVSDDYGMSEFDYSDIGFIEARKYLWNYFGIFVPGGIDSKSEAIWDKSEAIWDIDEYDKYIEYKKTTNYSGKYPVVDFVNNILCRTSMGGKYVVNNGKKEYIPYPKSFYAEFSDFDINRCGDWVKKNVVEKLQLTDNERFLHHHNNLKRVKDDTRVIKKSLANWMELFKDYQIQFVCDCGTWDWYWMVRLLAEWEEIPYSLVIPEMYIPDGKTLDDFIKEWEASPVKVVKTLPKEFVQVGNTRTGLPKLPSNISPVPEDLNDLIAIKKGISIREAFDLDREELTISKCLLIDESKFKQEEINNIIEMYRKDGTFDTKLAEELKSDTYIQLRSKYKHNALWNAKVVKEIYQKLNNNENS